MILDCKYLADNKKEKIRKIISEENLKPTLFAIRVDNDKAYESYLKGIQKDCDEVGINLKMLDLSKPLDMDKEPQYTCPPLKAIIQQPIPKMSIETRLEYKTLMCGVENIENLHGGWTPTVSAILEIIDIVYHKLDNKTCVIINRSESIGIPLALKLIKKNAMVTVCNSTTDINKIYESTRKADIVISATGQKHLIHADDIKEDSLVIDVGVCFENGKMYGDVDFMECKDKALLVTPTPNGLGLLTRAELLSRII